MYEHMSKWKGYIPSNAGVVFINTTPTHPHHHHHHHHTQSLSVPKTGPNAISSMAWYKFDHKIMVNHYINILISTFVISTS